MNNIKKQYDAFADSYSDAIKEKGKLSREVYYRYLDFPMEGKTILDAGCGEGTELAFCQGKGAKVYGIDTSKEMVRLAKEKVPDATVSVGDFTHLPFEDNFFDAVITKHAIHIASDVSTVISEFTRVLKTNGVLVILTVHPIRQFMEKKKKNKDYFKQEIVESILFGGLVKVKEPTHTMNDYLSDGFLQTYDMLAFNETYDPYSAEKVDGDAYPGFMIIKARKRPARTDM